MSDMPPSPDRSEAETERLHEDFMRLFVKHEPDLRTFIRSLVPTLTDADEVLQETAIVLWRKFETFEPGTEFIRWACVIARFEALAYRRKIARDRLVLGADVTQLLADEAIDELPERRREREALESCLRQLPENQQRLVTKAYTPGIKTKDLAEGLGKSPASLYMALNRIRAALMRCIEKRLAAPDPPLDPLNVV